MSWGSRDHLSTLGALEELGEQPRTAIQSQSTSSKAQEALWTLGRGRAERRQPRASERSGPEQMSKRLPPPPLYLGREEGPWAPQRIGVRWGPGVRIELTIVKQEMCPVPVPLPPLPRLSARPATPFLWVSGCQEALSDLICGDTVGPSGPEDPSMSKLRFFPVLNSRIQI